MHDRPAGALAAACHGEARLARGEAVGFRRVTVAFALSGGGSYPAIAATDLAVGAHEFVAIVGPTGCGKSTLLNLAAGLLAPSSGEVLVLGAPLTSLNMRAGYLFQQDAVMPWKTARDNVAIGLEVAGIARAEAVERAQAWLERVGLGAFGERYPHQLSGAKEAGWAGASAHPRAQDPADGRAVRAA